MNQLMDPAFTSALGIEKMSPRQILRMCIYLIEKENSFKYFHKRKDLESQENQDENVIFMVDAASKTMS